MNILEQINAEQVAKLTEGKTIPAFQPGDTVIVNVKVKEGERSRVQAYEGVCIARNGGGRAHEACALGLPASARALRCGRKRTQRVLHRHVNPRHDEKKPG